MSTPEEAAPEQAAAEQSAPPAEESAPAQSSAPPPPAKEEKPGPKRTPSEEIDTEVGKPFDQKIKDFFSKLYNDKFCREVVKSVIIFCLAIKAANECRKISIPLKDYEPFKRICTYTCKY